MSYIKPYQPSLFDYPLGGIELDIARGRELAKVGMELAVETANRKEKGWSLLCWQLFLVWLRRNVKRGSEFMVEDFRMHLYKYDLITPPPSNRAFAFLPLRAQKGGWIEFVRKDTVKNKKAHAANASVWRKK